MSIAARYLSKSLCLISALLIGPFTAFADLPREDEKVVKSTVQLVLRDFDNRVERYTSPNGRGEVSTRLVYSESIGLPCPQFECVDPCREFGYTYSGPDTEQNVVEEIYKGLACRAGSGDWAIRSENRVERHVFQLATQSPRVATQTTQASPATVPAVPKPQPRAYSRVKATRAQELLANLYYYDGSLDGDFGPGSIRALQSFLADESISWSTYPVTDQLLDDVIARAELALSR